MPGDTALEIRIRGIVQGVGFRPMVWHLARKLGLRGDVCNDGAGVLVHIAGPAAARATFLEGLRANAPPLSQIDRVESRSFRPGTPLQAFRILTSTRGTRQTQISADAATCAACLAEVLDPTTRRYHYPFANCTHCGPRFSIVTGVPYDRENTSMAKFTMCPSCQREYDSPQDRRFHAQPIACTHCGPRIWLEDLGPRGSNAEAVKPARDQAALQIAAQRIKAGDIIALKGLGGFHLTCDASNIAAVQRLRDRKHRDAKAFALMARDLSVIRRYAQLSKAEAVLLKTPAAPIILLQSRFNPDLSPGIAPRLDSLGFMLPNAPLYHLLLAEFDVPLVMTSANLAGNPQVIDNQQARQKLAGIADCALFHDRGIANRIDDSVVRFIAKTPRLIRRARGYAPGFIPLPDGFAKAPDLLALGGAQKNTFCLLKGGALVLSQHQGDLDNPETLDELEKNLALYQALYDHRPDYIVRDLHPEYRSSKLAKQRGQDTDTPILSVQHHHAHIASCMVENAYPLAGGDVLGVALDGLGMGTEGSFWGGEFLRANYNSFTRLAHFKPIALPGGDQAARQPWRNTFAHLEAAFGWTEFSAKYDALPLRQFLAQQPVQTLSKMIQSGVNAPKASSVGRLFDAVAAALDLCPKTQLYEGQAAIELESLAASALGQAGYEFELRPAGGHALPYIEPKIMWQTLLADLKAGRPKAEIARCFHNGLADIILKTIKTLCAQHGLKTVVLSGGCFQNKLLLAAVLRGLSPTNLKVLSHAQVPANDGGLALGQAAIAAARQLQ